MEQHAALRMFNQVLLALLLFFSLLSLGSAFIIPVAIGGLFAMLLVPVCRKMEEFHFPRVLAAFISVFAILIVLVFIIGMVINQLANLANDLPRLDQRLNEVLNDIHHSIRQNFDVSQEKQKEYLQRGIRQSLESIGTYITNIFILASSFLVYFFIVMTYSLLFLIFRTKIKNFIFRISGTYSNNDARAIIHKIIDVANSYIAGVFMVVFILTAINTIGLMAIGIEHALLFGLVAGILNIIPYLGSLVGSIIPVLFALLTKDSFWYPVSVAIFFFVVQNIESYFLTPNLTGSKIKLNPLATLMALLLGSATWGIAGMILFVPYMGILKVVFDNIEKFKPYGYLLGKEKEPVSDVQ